MNIFRKQIIWLLLSLCTIFFACSKAHFPNGKTYRVGIDPVFFPLETMGQENNLYGFTHELLLKFAEESKVNITLEKLHWDNVVSSVKNHTCDAVISTMRPYNFYKQEFDFSDPFLPTGPALIASIDQNYDSVNSLSGKRVGVISGSDNAVLLERNPEITIVNFNALATMLDEIVSNNIDAALLEVFIANAYCRDLYQNQIHITASNLNDSGLRLLSLKDKETDFLKAFDSFYQSIKGEKLNELLSKWSLEIAYPE